MARQGTLVSELVAQVRDEFVFDATDEQILRWLNGKHRTMVVDSECLLASLDLGVSDGSGFVLVPERVLRLQQLLVDGVPWTRVARADIAALENGSLLMSGLGGVFAPDADSGSDEVLVMYPAPAVGEALEGYASMRPEDLTAEGRVVTPPEFDEALVHGAAAVGFKRDAEQLAVGQALDAEFLANVEKLRRQVRRKARSGPAQIRVQGLNA